MAARKISSQAPLLSTLGDLQAHSRLAPQWRANTPHTSGALPRAAKGARGAPAATQSAGKFCFFKRPVRGAAGRAPVMVPATGISRKAFEHPRQIALLNHKTNH